MAFYKLDNETVLEAPNFVYSPIVTLEVESKDEFEYPQDGWYWFESKEDAYVFFGIKLND